MKRTKRPRNRRSENTIPKSNNALLDAAAAAGALAGAAVGAVAGPPGIVAGGLIGTAVGGLAGLAATEAETAHERHEHELDDAIGVTKGALGAARRGQPPAKRGTFSAASAGVSSSAGSSPAEGPMQDLDADA
jgi:hypothetical protein